MKSWQRIAVAVQKLKWYLPAYGTVPEQPRIIVHIPHSSTKIPKLFRKEFLPEKEKLRSELLCMTDWYTDELFSCPDCLTVVHQYSRLVCDPERFLDPEEEIMWRKGMGMYYTRMSDGGRFAFLPGRIAGLRQGAANLPASSQPADRSRAPPAGPVWPGIVN